MTTDPPILGSILGPKSKHGFFKSFPKELRDSIYDLTYQKVETQYSHSHLCVTTPVVELRLVSRQFMAEYDDRCSQNEYLGQILFKGAVTQPGNGDRGNEDFFNFPKHATRATDMTAVLKARDCEDDKAQDLDSDMLFKSILSRDWLCEVAAQLPCLDRIKVYLEHTDRWLSYPSLPYFAEITSNPEVIRIELLQAGHLFVEGVDHRALATWTAERGFRQDEELGQQYLRRMLDRAQDSLNKMITVPSSGNMAQ